mgnify:CR=1 FL=1
MSKQSAYGLPSGSIRAVLALIIFAAIWVLMIKAPTEAVPAYLQNLMFIIMGHYFASRSRKDPKLNDDSRMNEVVDYLTIKYGNQPQGKYGQTLGMKSALERVITAVGDTKAVRTVPRVDEIKEPKEYSPLYLPKGTIRILIIGGFLSVACFLAYHSKLWLDGTLSQSAISLILVAGFMLGVIRSQLFTKQRRWLEDIRATISLAAGLALLAMVFGYLTIPEIENLNLFQHFAVKFRYEEVLAALVGFYFGSKS